jgi:hypothetical protein
MLTTILLAFVATSPPTAPAQSDSVQRYRLELSVRSEVDLTAVGAAMQVQEQSAIGFIAVTLRDSAGGRALDMDAPRWVGEHLQHVIFRPPRIAAGREEAGLVPRGLPARLDLGGVVAGHRRCSPGGGRRQA